MKEFIFLTVANNLPRLRIFDKLRWRILRLAGLNIEGSCTIWGQLVIRPIGCANNIYIGKGSFINTNIRFGVPRCKVVLGRNVQIGPGVMFETVTHGLVYEGQIGRGSSSKNIIVEDEVWIGAGCIITLGVTIGKGSVVAAGSVVTKDISPNSLVGGVPARFIKSTNQ